MNRKLYASVAIASVLAAGAGIFAIAMPPQSMAYAQAESEDHADHEEHEGEGEAHGEGEVHLTPDQLNQLDVRVGAAQAGSAEAIVEAPATVAFDEDQTARIGPRLPAKLVRVVTDLGEPVAEGEPIAVLDSVELGKAKARFLTAAAREDVARQEYERERSLAAESISSEAEMLEARARYVQAQAELQAAREELRLYGLTGGQIDSISAGGGDPLSRYVLTSPISGVLQHRDAVPGETIDPGQSPFTVVDPGQMWLYVDVFERNLRQVAPGQSLTFTAPALDGATFQGEVDWVSRSLDEEARTVRVRATLPNPDGVLRDGMFGSAVIQTDTRERYALVPIDAVQTMDDGDSVVFVPTDEEGAFRAQPVSIGEESGGMVEIRRGLEPGADVVTVGAFDLMSAMTASGRSAAHSH